MTDAEQILKLAALAVGFANDSEILSKLDGPTLAAVLHVAADAVQEATTAQANVRSLTSILASTGQ